MKVVITPPLEGEDYYPRNKGAGGGTSYILRHPEPTPSNTGRYSWNSIIPFVISTRLKQVGKKSLCPLFPSK